MRANELLTDSAVNELAKRLPSLAKHDYNEIDKLMRRIAKKHQLGDKALEDLFARRYHRHPRDWFDKIDEDGSMDRNERIEHFIHWAIKTLNIQQPYPKITLSSDTDNAQQGHHTGVNYPSQNTMWIYIGNRNLVDILRTVFHELTHVRQAQLNMIGPDQSYPGSPVEVLADAMAGKYIKIYGEQHPEIFE